ncbi:MAG TPA: hypothetical protein VF630_04650 [Hymenobacter sp.]
MLLAVGALLGSHAATAQIVRAKPGQVKSANRRALREAQRTESPYKDSHLGVTPARLKRGQSTQPQPEVSNDVRYKRGNSPTLRPSSVLNMRRKKKE